MDSITFSRSEEDALRRLGVTAVILFGSQARGRTNTSSDYDVGVLAHAHGADRQKALYEGLYDMLSPKIGKLVNIDIVFLDSAPLELCHHVAKYGLAIFEAPSGMYARFKEIVMERYADFAPYRRMFQKQLLGRIPS